MGQRLMSNELKLDNALAKDIKPVKINDKVTSLQLGDDIVRIEKDLEVGGDISLEGGDLNFNNVNTEQIKFGDNTVIQSENNDALSIESTGLLVSGVQQADQTSVSIITQSGQDSKYALYNGATLRWTLGNDADDSNKLKIDSDNLTVGGNTKLTLDSSGNLTVTGDITSNNGVSQGKFIYDIQRCGYYSSSANASYLPLNGYIFEKTATSGNNEFIAFVAPFNGTLEKIMWRSEIAQDGNFRNHIYESEDGTEVPGTSIGRWDSTHDIADDTVITFDFTTGATSGNNILTKGRIYAIAIDPPTAPQDTNATVVFKWDITT